MPLDAIHRAIEFFERHLKEPIGVADAAGTAGYSLFHFCRLFNRHVHHTPYDYLMRRRLSEAARELAGTERRIIDVALDYQFSSHETFSRAFRRMFDDQPSHWRMGTPIDERCLMPRLTLAHLLQIDKGPCLKPTIVERPACHLAGLMTRLSSGREDVAELWRLLAAQLDGLPGKADPAGYYGIVSHSASPSGCDRFYMAAVAVAQPVTTNPILVSRTLPSGAYARFAHSGPMAQVSLSLDYFYHTWLPRSGRRLSAHLEVEHYGCDPCAAQDADVRHEICVPLGGVC